MATAEVARLLGITDMRALDPNFVAEQIVRVAFEQYYLSTEEAARFQSEGGRLRTAVSSHKWDAASVADRTFWISQCRSVRPAYCVLFEKEGKRTELVHMYAAMGLHRAHEFQQVLAGDANPNTWLLPFCAQLQIFCTAGFGLICYRFS